MIAEFLCKTKTPKCTPVKNPCKICLEQVTNKNGLQCQGTCKKWAHYKCLQYTPGKISDIKAGLLKVLCPCPDCETTQDKEYLTNLPYTCSNQNCPANAKGPARCTLDECPQNAKKTIKNRCSPEICADDALNSLTQLTRKSYPGRPSEDETEDATKTKYPPPRQIYTDHPSEHALEGPTQTKQPRGSPIPNIKKIEKKAEKAGPTNDSKNNSCDDLLSEKQNITEDGDVDQMKNALHEMCGTVTQLSKQIKDLMCKIKMKEENQVKVPNKPK